jgi:NTE family protein
MTTRRNFTHFGRLVCAVVLLAAPATASAQQRARVGVAFGGGSARGIAHIGVIQWFEEHRIPIDVAAGTSMGGLVGGGYATGMSASELRTLIESTDWDLMFGASSFPFKNIRRKQDARSYPSRLEFGLKGGIVPPTALNDGQQVDLLLARIAAPYYALDDFDELPTPFRTVAVDLRTAERVVIGRGWLAAAMRATMSLPGIFPPVEIGNRVLVDGGALDNVPADVVRDMGAGVVIAIDVGYGGEPTIDYSLFGLMGQTIDSMMRANTRRAIAQADIVLAVDVAGFGSLDWRRADDLIQRGYQAAERHRDELLRFALPEAEWTAWVSARDGRRKRTVPDPQYIATSGIDSRDASVVRKKLRPRLGAPLAIEGLEKDLSFLSGLDRYQGLSWQTIGPPGQEGLLVRGREKPYAPPFMMLGVRLQNTTSDDFSVQLAGRYLAFDVFGPRSELRIDGVIGSDPSAAIVLHRPLGNTRLFGRPYAAAERQTIDIVNEGSVIAQYRLQRTFVGAELGVDLSRESEIAGGIQFGRVDATVRAGDPGLPELGGSESIANLHWAYDGQDSPVVPTHGTRALFTLQHFVNSPRVAGVERTNDGVTQAEVASSTVWSLNRRDRLLFVFNGGTSFDGKPLSQFRLGFPFRLDAFSVGEKRGDHYAVVTAGYLRQIGRLPDFMGGPVHAGVWLENGSAFDTDEDADINTHIGAGLVLDTLLGPVVGGVGAGVDGGWRVFFAIGAIFGR